MLYVGLGHLGEINLIHPRAALDNTQAKGGVRLEVSIHVLNNGYIDITTVKGG